jgi:hypothetical protein
LISYIEIIIPDGRVDKIDDIFAHEGGLKTLWRLIGQRMIKIDMEEASFRVPFERGALIRVKYGRTLDFVFMGS